ncbi:MAG: ATP-binding cassette domain-containing protein [Phycisphaerales bacterium]
MIEVHSIRKAFGRVQALDGIAFVAHRGEVLGLLGPNGAGKSTCIAVCTGQVDPDSGSVDVAGRGSPRDPGVRLLIGVAPQQVALND